jgi:hypothetical protein
MRPTGAVASNFMDKFKRFEVSFAGQHLHYEPTWPVPSFSTNSRETCDGSIPANGSGTIYQCCDTEDAGDQGILTIVEQIRHFVPEMPLAKATTLLALGGNLPV